MRRNVRWKEISYVMQGSMSVLNPVRKIIKTFEDIVDTHEPITDKKKFLEADHAPISTGWDSRPKSSTPIRTSFRAACGSGWPLPWRPCSNPA